MSANPLVNHRDIKIHGAYGDTVVNLREQKEEEGKASHRNNVKLYLKALNEPNKLVQIRKKGCLGWPCQQGYLCDFCVLRCSPSLPRPSSSTATRW